ncbi:MAG: bacteriophage abortive infection AbiH family protein [Lachnospiraceae bacterium]|jgi:hypothetical protein|nr:bacteriophage abortive infection AbiH family protein [Lachnospiraceae bacterium]MCI1656811.1 bacteriophage abortive infection AbiH family protein [Lachnospiraceae bacterium]MCI2195183.1 bacteriophage abortive infection AbiH family protein [Lachnospiraceae bacterium]
MATLNIIGNGFDLYHGLPTSYYFFACYFLKNYEEEYDQLADMYGISKGLYSHISEDLTRGIDDKGFWSQFEKSLGYIDSEWVEDSLIDDLNLEIADPPVTLEIDRPNLVSDIKGILHSWILNTVDKNEIYAIVKNRMKDNYIQFNEDDKFISFNYTHTLENVYEIEDVFHIHGECCNDNEDELIIGHGNDKGILRLQNEINELEDDAQFYQAANNRVQEYSFEKEILESLRKPVNECVNELERNLLSYEKPDLISVYGCSLGKVDLPYMKLIHKKWSDVKWRFSVYSSRDRKWIAEAAHQICLEEGQWMSFEFKNLLSSHIQKEIVLKEGIITYPTMDELLSKN